MTPSWILNSKRHLELVSAANEKKQNGRVSLYQKRILIHLAVATTLLLFVASSGVSRLTVILLPLLIELLISRSHSARVARARWPTGIYIGAFVIQVLIISYINRQTTPRELAVLGLAPPSKGFPGGSSGDPRVLVGPDGVVASPFEGLDEAAVINAAVTSSIHDSQPYVTGDEFSIIIPVRNEEMYLSKTIKFTLDITPAKYIKEIIVVDDASNIPMADVLDRELSAKHRKMVKVLRFDTKEGLIRARIFGADTAVADNIFFLDGHCKPKRGWIEPLLRHLKANYKRLACPVIQDIRKDTWEDVGTSGAKMMFEWNFEFGWYDDLTDEVPISAGGVLAMTKKWWNESGKYDPGMLEWGGENLEQSMRVWLCGGEIFVVRNSFVGHIFDRPPKPNPGNSLVTQVQKNQKRGALLWLDEYYKLFETFHPVVKTLDEGPGLEERFALRQKLNCRSFQWYVDKFKTAFERKGLLINEYRYLMHPASRWCLTAAIPTPGLPENKGRKPSVVLDPCLRGNFNQEWQAVAGGRMLYNRATSSCLDGGSSGMFFAGKKQPLLIECQWNELFEGSNNQQFWQFDGIHTGRVFSYSTKEYKTLTGNDKMSIDSGKAQLPTSSCLSSDLHFWETHRVDVSSVHGEGSAIPVDVEIKPCKSSSGIGDWKDPQGFQWLW